VYLNEGSYQLSLVQEQGKDAISKDFSVGPRTQLVNMEVPW
jgi:hypothetical protein